MRIVRLRKRSHHRTAIAGAILVALLAGPLAQASPAVAMDPPTTGTATPGDPPLPAYPGLPDASPSQTLAAVSTTPTPCDNNGADETVTRAEVLGRAQSWLSVVIPYSQYRCYGNQYGDYRTDCSGFVSMAWGLGGSGSAFWTGNILDRSYVIARSNLQPGDALWRHTGDPDENHIALFVRWQDAAHTRPFVYEQTGSSDTVAREWSSSYASLYTPIRYDNIIDSELPLIGDWDGDGDDTVGVYRPGNSQFLLRNSNSSGWADLTFTYGSSGDIPLVGDWNRDGRDTIGVYRPSTGQFLLRNSNDSGSANISFTYGSAGEVPIVGDWDGDGWDTIGVYRPGNSQFLLRNSLSSGWADLTFTYGSPGNDPLVGDWNRDGRDTIGVYRPGTSEFLLRNSNDSGSANISFRYGTPGDVPLVGDWDGDGWDTIGVRQGTTFMLSNSLGSGWADITFAYGR